MPEKGSFMEFENCKKMLERPSIVCADCECSVVPTGDKYKTHEHKVNSCCYYFVCNFDSKRNKMKAFEGANCLVNMLKELNQLSWKCIEEMKGNKRMVMTKEDEKKHKEATHCHICKKELGKEDRVRDHDHRTGKYGGPAHNSCNTYLLFFTI
jgi:hypothetical protein